MLLATRSLRQYTGFQLHRQVGLQTPHGGIAQNCPVSDEIREVALKAAGIVGEGVYGVDMMECGGELLVHEINHTIDFRKSLEPTSCDIPGKIIDYFVERVRR